MLDSHTYSACSTWLACILPTASMHAYEVKKKKKKKCLKWGHTAYVCKARFPACDQCAGPHLSSLHDQHVLSCKEKHCSHYGITCANCDGSHHASSMTCPFFKARSSPGELSKLQKARVERPSLLDF